MNEKEFFEWMETCPSHEWEVNYSDDDGCMVIFKLQEEE